MPSELALAAIRYAQQELDKHVQETSKDAGPEVDQYLTRAGVPSPNQWCMSFMYWCFSEAAHSLGMAAPARLKRTGNCWDQWESCPQYQVQNAEVGDILIFKDEEGECNRPMDMSPLIDYFPVPNLDAINDCARTTIGFEEHTFDLAQVTGHAGIVTAVGGGYVSTIEGNSGNGNHRGSKYVASHRYSLAANRCRKFGEGRRIIAGFLRVN